VGCVAENRLVVLPCVDVGVQVEGAVCIVAALGTVERPEHMLDAACVTGESRELEVAGARVVGFRYMAYRVWAQHHVVVWRTQRATFHSLADTVHEVVVTEGLLF
jgi:hypothetical protein